MLWIVLVLIAVLTFALDDLLNKFVITKEVRDPYLGTAVFGFIALAVFTAISLSMGSISFDPELSLIGVITGLVTSSALWFYFSALSKEEVSRAMPILGTAPLFVLPFGFFLFGEVFTPLKYLGIGLIVLGSALLSFKDVKGVFKLDRLMFLMFAAAFFFALRNVFVKLSTQSTAIWSVLFWIGIGRGLVSTAITALHHPKLKEKAEKGIEHLFLTGSFSSIGMITLFLAISLGPVSLVSAFLGMKPLLVLLLATLVTLLHPSFIREKITSRILIQKISSTVMIVLGGAFILL